jgi:hypothetical protein
MLSVALVRDPIGPTSAKGGRWGKWRLGQVVLLLEVVSKVQTARIAKEAGGEVCPFLYDVMHDNFNGFLGSQMDRDAERDWMDTVKCIIELEGRLGILLDDKVRAFCP